jgi:hypothetical protein
MGKNNQILKMATVYSMFAIADLRENMALRILHALIPTLVQDIHNAQEVENIQKFMAFDLIPGAKEIFELGAKAIAYEFDNSANEQLKQEVQQAIENKEYTKGLELSVPGFLSGFRVTTGNEAWSNIAKHLLHLDLLIKRVEKSESPKDALRLSTYLDTIDQLAHNAGSLMEKLVQREMNTITPESQERYQELLRLRDISKMEGDYPTSLLMQQYLKGKPKEYREWYKHYLAMHNAAPEKELANDPSGHKHNEQWQYQKYLGVPVEEGGGYNEALQLLQKTKRERELANYLTTPNDPGMISQEYKKAPPPPPKKQLINS